MTSARVHLAGPDRQFLTCKEYTEIDVLPEQVMTSGGQLRIFPDVLKHYVATDFKDGRLRVRARGVSGVFALTEDITVQVRPRFPLTNLTHMVSVCGYIPTALEAMRTYHSTDKWEDWLLDVVADAFLVAMETIEERGLLRTYRHRTEDSSYPHGRIEMGATINRHAARGIDHKATYSWFEKSADNPVNRCLRAAAVYLHGKYHTQVLEKGTRERIARLGNVLRLLEEAGDDRYQSFADDSLVRGATELPGAREYYRPALNLALIALEGRGLDLDADGGPVSMGSLLIKTEDLFESFVRLSLQRALATHPELSVLDGNVTPGKRELYEEIDVGVSAALPPHSSVVGKKVPDATPDLLLEDMSGAFPLVADVKYTNVREYAERSELEQAITYGVRYNSPVVMTIHPRRKNAPGGLVISGRVGKIFVAQYRVDLAAEDLDAEMDAMAQSLAHLVSATATT